MNSQLIKSFLALVLIFASGQIFADTAPPTVRVDYYHSGNAESEMFSLHQVVIEPLPWPGHPGKPLDTVRRGYFMFQVEDPDTGNILYSRGFSSIFQEWQSTGEAKQMNRSFHESVRFPKPEKPVLLRIMKRNADQGFDSIWTQPIDTDDMMVVRAHAPAPAELQEIHVSGAPADKVDIVLLGDGYSASDANQFTADALRLTKALFTYSPFRERSQDFNVWAINPPAPESGVNRPSNGTFRFSPSGTTYDAFRAERYILSFDNLGMREIIQHSPYEFVVVLGHSETYGGGGIYGLYSTVAAGSEWADYLFVHEFGHHFAALADEYYTSEAVYEPGSGRTEPWEPNVTALHDPAQVKWAHLVQEGTALPTEWPKKAFENFQRENQARRAQLRKDQRPESEMNQLFRDEQAWVSELFAGYPDTNTVIGAFEGANYAATGYFRSEMNCTMFTRHDRFCRVCSEALIEVIDLYSKD
ncbi:M64 family metallopeptidase [Pseudomonadota bacterium]